MPDQAEGLRAKHQRCPDCGQQMRGPVHIGYVEWRQGAKQIRHMACDPVRVAAVEVDNVVTAHWSDRPAINALENLRKALRATSGLPDELEQTP